MRKLVVFLHSSLDGFVEGAQSAMDIGWVAYNSELEEFADKGFCCKVKNHVIFILKNEK